MMVLPAVYIEARIFFASGVSTYWCMYMCMYAHMYVHVYVYVYVPLSEWYVSKVVRHTMDHMPISMVLCMCYYVLCMYTYVIRFVGIYACMHVFGHFVS